MPQVPQQQALLPDFGTVDPATYMSPMDLYDSIFWGKLAGPGGIGLWP